MKSSSISPISKSVAHSAYVDMQLLIDGLSFGVAQMGHDFILLEKPVNHPPTIASLTLQVDQSKTQWNVMLPDGISAGSARVRIAATA
jgi:hypothetical protein